MKKTYENPQGVKSCGTMVLKNYKTVQLELTVYDSEENEKLIYRSKTPTGFSFKTKSGEDLEIVLTTIPSMNQIKTNGRGQSLSEFEKSSNIKVGSKK